MDAVASTRDVAIDDTAILGLTSWTVLIITVGLIVESYDAYLKNGLHDF